MREVGLWPWIAAATVGLGLSWLGGWRPAFGNEAQAGIQHRVNAVVRDLAGQDQTALVISNSRLGAFRALDAAWWRRCGRPVDASSALLIGTLNFSSVVPHLQPLRALRLDVIYVEADVLFAAPRRGLTGDLLDRVADQFAAWDPDAVSFSQGLEFMARARADGADVRVIEAPLRADLAAKLPPARRASWERGYARIEAAGFSILRDAQPTDPSRFTDAVHVDEVGQAELRRWFCAQVGGG